MARKEYGIPEVPEDALERKVKWSYPKQIEKLENKISELKKNVFPGKNVQELIDCEIDRYQKQLDKYKSELIDYQSKYNNMLLSDQKVMQKKLEKDIEEDEKDDE